MIFILFSAVNEQTISTSLGKPEYSYYFVRQGFADVLQDLGEVHTVFDPANEVDAIYDDAAARGVKSLFFCFTPPNKMIRGLRCPTVVVFAWEFDSIPQASYGMTGPEDWAVALQEAGHAISLSSHSRDVVKKMLGDGFKISAVPVPIPLLKQEPKVDMPGHCFEVNGTVIDTARYIIQPDGIKAQDPLAAFPMPPWDGEAIKLSFSRNADPPASLCGFYTPEFWGAWSSFSEAWVLLPQMVSGDVFLDLRFRGYGANIGRTITVSMGPYHKQMRIDPDDNAKRLSFSIAEPVNTLTFSNLVAQSIPGQPDPRSMGIGLMRAVLTRCGPTESRQKIFPARSLQKSLKIGGVLYTSVLSPKCGRKNWRDMITAFCYAFRDTPDATLLIKVSAQHHSEYFSELHELFAQLSPFECRILVVQGFLSTEAYRRLVALTDFYVNTSRAEGQCLPLMEFMVQGKPAIAPRHTALLDYVRRDANFLVGSSEELTIWPHDPSEKYTTRRHRIDWNDLFEAYKESYQVAKTQPERYRKMSLCAGQRIVRFASRDQVKKKLKASLFEWEFDASPGVGDSGTALPLELNLAKCGRTITQAGYSVTGAQKRIGEDFPVVSIPSPVWDDYRCCFIKKSRASKDPFLLKFQGTLIDSAALDFECFNRDAWEASLRTWKTSISNKKHNAVSIAGIVYLSVFNPNNQRKNWQDMLRAFCWEFKHTPDATLVLKVSHKDGDRMFPFFLKESYKLNPFACRVLVVHGYLEEKVYSKLIKNSHYVVNSSHGEEQGLPLMEGMAAGKPAIAPDHTAMQDYLTPQNAFIVKSSPEPAFRPDDPKQRLFALRYRIDWESLCAAFRKSYETIKEQPEVYANMSLTAYQTMERHCVREASLPKIKNFPAAWQKDPGSFHRDRQTGIYVRCLRRLLGFVKDRLGKFKTR